MRIDRDRLRIYALAIATGPRSPRSGWCWRSTRTDAKALALLFFVEAVILGLVFGAKPGMAGAVLPLVLLYPIALDRSMTSAIRRSPLSALLFLVIVQAFLAGMAGALRDRYWTRSVPPPGA